MLYFVTKIKTDLRDDTISVSSRTAAAPNFDFDGKLALPHIAVKQYAYSLKLLETPKALCPIWRRKSEITTEIAHVEQTKSHDNGQSAAKLLAITKGSSTIRETPCKRMKI